MGVKKLAWKHLSAYKALLAECKTESGLPVEDTLSSVTADQVGLEELHRRVRNETDEHARMGLGLAAADLAFTLANVQRDATLLVRSVYTLANYCNTAAKRKLGKTELAKTLVYANVAKLLFEILANPRYAPSIEFAVRTAETATRFLTRTRQATEDRLTGIAKELSGWRVSQEDFTPEASLRSDTKTHKLGFFEENRDILSILGFQSDNWLDPSTPRAVSVSRLSFPWSELDGVHGEIPATAEKFIEALERAVSAFRAGSFSTAAPEFLSLSVSYEVLGPRPGPAGITPYLLIAYVICLGHTELSRGMAEVAAHLFFEAWGQTRRTPAFLRLLDYSSEQIISDYMRAILVSSECGAAEGGPKELPILINQKLLSNDYACRYGIQLALVRLLATAPELLDELSISDKARFSFKQGLLEKFKNPKIQEDRPLHEIVSIIALEFGRHVRSMTDNAEALTMDPSVQMLMRVRPQLIEASKRLQPYTTQTEGRALDRLTSILTEAVSAYQRNPDLKMKAAVIEQVRTAQVGSVHHRSRLLDTAILPVMLAISQLIETDFQKKVESQRTTVSIGVDKQEYPLSPEGKELDVVVKVSNNGNSTALNAALVISSSDESQNDIAVLDGAFQLGDLAVGAQPVSRTVRLRVGRPADAITLDYLIYWNNTAGMEQDHRGTLKILAQKRISWPDVVANPYTLGSIKDPDKLKGRDPQLTVLRGGIATTTSFFVTGQKRVGKSSIAQVFASQLYKMPNVLATYTVLGEVLGNDPDTTWIVLDLCETLGRAFHRKTGMNLGVPIPSVEHVKENFARAFSSFLEDFHEKHPDYRLYFIIDEFDELPEVLYETDSGSRFFLTLRALIDRDYVGFIFVGSEKLPFILSKQGERLNQVRPARVDYLARPDIARLVKEPSSGLLQFEEPAVSAIYEASAGNPYYATAICQRLWSEMVARQDYFVSRLDAEKTIERIAIEDQVSSYSHFWTDGIKAVSLEEARRIENENAAILTAVAYNAQDVGEFAAEPEIVTQARDILPHLSDKSVMERLDNLWDRQVLERDQTGTSYRVKVPLFSSWLRAGGATKIGNLYKQPAFHVVRTELVTPRQLVELCGDLAYRGERVNEVQVRAWLEQFGNQRRQWLAFRLLLTLRARGYFSESAVNSACRQLLQQIMTRGDEEYGPVQTLKKGRLQNVLVSHVDHVGKSGGALVTSFRRVNQISAANAGAIDELAQRLRSMPGPKVVILVDNFVGTGSAGSEDLGKTLAKFDQYAPGWRKDTDVFYAVVAGFEQAEDVVTMKTKHDVRVVIQRLLTDRDRAFNPEADIFEDDHQRSEAMDMCADIGRHLEPKHPLGWGGSQALVVFHDNVPNNTLPIFHKRGRHYQGKEWVPIFPRD